MTDLRFGNQGTLQQQVRQSLLSKITKLRQGHKLPSERELAASYKVDRGTVRRAMSDLEKEGYVARHRGRGTFVVNQDVHEVVSSMTTRKLALIMPTVEVPQFAAMFEGVEAEAAKRGYRVVSCLNGLDCGRESSLLEDLAREGVDKIIITVSLKNSTNPDFIKQLKDLQKKGVDIVTLDRYLPDAGVPSSTLAKVRMGYIAAEHLIVLGHSKICFVSEHTFSPTGDDAFIGYKRALQDYNIEFDPSLVIDISAMNCAVPAKDAILNLFSNKPNACTAITTTQFSMTYGIYRALEQLGKKIPEDIALIGVDVYANPELAHLTHVLQPVKELGVEAVKLLLNKDENNSNSLKKHAVLEPELVIGTSCGAKKNE